jgi:L-alanine-DL-glutamate epimerase-like enolase superfamily enzyme
MVGIKEPAALCDSSSRSRPGLRGFKLKIGRGLSSDVEGVRRVRERSATTSTSRSTRTPHTTWLGPRSCALNWPTRLHCIEQPLPYLDIDAMAALRAASSVPLMADQLVQSAADAVRVAQAGAADLVS